MLALLAAIVWCMLDARRYTPAFVLAYESLQHDADLTERLGGSLEAGTVFGRFSVSDTGQEHARLSFSVSGSRARGTAYVWAHEVASIWRITRLEVELDHDGERLVFVSDPPSEARVGDAPKTPTDAPPLS